MSVTEQDDMQDRRRSYIDPQTGELILLEWDNQRDGWAPSIRTMESWNNGRLRIYNPTDDPDMYITMPGHSRWPRLRLDEEEDIRVLLAHPWIPDGQAAEGLFEDQIEDLDALQHLFTIDEVQRSHPLLDSVLRPTLFMDMPMTLVTRATDTLLETALIASMTQHPRPPPRSPPPPFPKHLADQVLASAEAAGQICPITMDPIRKANASVTSCGHVFQKAAITEWMQGHDTCPECRQLCSI